MSSNSIIACRYCGKANIGNDRESPSNNCPFCSTISSFRGQQSQSSASQRYYAAADVEIHGSSSLLKAGSDDKTSAYVVTGKENSEDVGVIKEEISLNDQFLGDNQLSALLAEITVQNVTQRLTLRGNCLTISGAALIASTLERDVAINFLSLEWNQIGSEGTERIARSLSRNKHLRYLDLRNNSIRDSGAGALAQFLASNDTLEVLDLRWNQIEDVGAESLQRLVKDRNINKPLKIMLAGNHVSEDYFTFFDAMAQPFYSSTSAKAGRGDISSSEIKDSSPNTTYSLLDRTSVHLRVEADQTYLKVRTKAEILEKEIAQLRQINTDLQTTNSDLLRQLDSSSVRITELEHDSVKHEFNNRQLTDLLHQTNERLAFISDEKKSLMGSWEIERSEIAAKARHDATEKGTRIRLLMAERDSLVDRLRQAENDIAQLTRQHEESLASAQREAEHSRGELLATLNKCTDLAIAESKYKAEISSLQSHLARASERASQSEAEIKLQQETHGRMMVAEIELRNKSMDALREEYNAQFETNRELVAKQLQEIRTLQSDVYDLQTAASRKDIEYQIGIDAAINEVKEHHRQHVVELTDDHKQRTNLLQMANKELESRCVSLQSELKRVNDERRESAHLLQQQLTSLETEIMRVRSDHHLMAEQKTKFETRAHKFSLEISEVRKENDVLGERAHDLRQKVQHLQLEKENLAAKVIKLEDLLKSERKQRAADFHSTAEHMLSAISKEFDIIRIKQQINENIDSQLSRNSNKESPKKQSKSPKSMPAAEKVTSLKSFPSSTEAQGVPKRLHSDEPNLCVGSPDKTSLTASRLQESQNSIESVEQAEKNLSTTVGGKSLRQTIPNDVAKQSSSVEPSTELGLLRTRSSVFQGPTSRAQAQIQSEDSNEDPYSDPDMTSLTREALHRSMDQTFGDQQHSSEDDEPALDASISHFEQSGFSENARSQVSQSFEVEDSGVEDEEEGDDDDEEEEGEDEDEVEEEEEEGSEEGDDGNEEVEEYVEDYENDDDDESN